MLNRLGYNRFKDVITIYTDLYQPIYFFPQTPIEVLEKLWEFPFPMLRGLPEYWASVDTWAGYYNILPGIYFVSTYGRVYDLEKNRIMKMMTNHRGYLAVGVKLIDDGHKPVMVHRLVAMTFKPIYGMEQLEVNHLDEIPDHNWIWNLEWTTHIENVRYSINTGKINRFGDNHPLHTITNEEAERIAIMLTTTSMTYQEIAEAIGPHCTKHVVNDMIQGHSRIALKEKYNLDDFRRNARQVTEPEVRRICQFFQDFKQSGGIVGTSIRDKAEFFKYTTQMIGYSLDERKYKRLVGDIYSKRVFMEISNQYDY